MSKIVKVIVVAVSVLAVVGIIISLIFWSMRPATVQDRLESSRTYQSIESIISVDDKEPVSLIIAPGESKWWDILLSYNNNEELENLDFSPLSPGLNYVAYSASQGKDFKSKGDLGLGTTFLFYSTALAAEEAASKITGASFNVKDNVVAFITPGAFSDVDYSFDSFYQEDAEVALDDLGLDGRAIMQINSQGFSETYTNDYPEAQTEVYRNFTALMGVTPETSWVGYSEDGLSWSGKFYNIELRDVTQPTALFDYFNQQQLIKLNDGSLVPIPTDGEIIPEFDQSGVVIPRQAILSSFMVYETAEEAGGALVSPETGEVVEEAEILTDGNLLRIKVNIVPWLTIMLEDNTSSILSSFSTMEVIVSDFDGSSTIVFERNSLN